MATIKDPVEKKAILLQIQEFGQIPKQLFTEPHSSRNSAPVMVKGLLFESTFEDERVRSPATFKGSSIGEMAELNRSSSKSNSFLSTPGPASKRVSQLGMKTVGVSLRKQLQIAKWYPPITSSLTDAIFVEDSSIVLCCCDDGLLRKFNLDSMDLENTFRVSEVALRSIDHLGGNSYVIGADDGMLYSFNLGYGVVSQKMEAHHDPVSKVLALQDKVAFPYEATDFLALGGWNYQNLGLLHGNH